ncbi:MAG: hypothetical protein ACYCVZ_17135 [Streptosporangiaceae bacterium]
MKSRLPFNRIDAVIGLIVVAGAVAAAIMIHRPLTYCSYLGGPPPPCAHPTDYPLALRLGIVAAGLVTAALIASIRHVVATRRMSRSTG